MKKKKELIEIEFKVKKRQYVKAGFQIALLICASFAFSYILHEGFKDVRGTNVGFNPTRAQIISNILTFLGKIIFGDKGFVTALESSDLEEGTLACIKSKDGKYCQEYPASECADKCEEACIPARKDSLSQCRLGTCYDNIEGTCQANSPEVTCEEGNGEWLDDPLGNQAQCKKGCCVLGDQALFSTQQQCSRQGQLYGIEGDFRAEVDTELECVLLSKTQEEGACVFEQEFENTCKFTTKANCLQINGDFRSGVLCSNPELKTNCKPQATAGCVANKDEIYWFDSCGNRENIYDENKVRSYNNGRTLTNNQSCSIGTASNPLANQNTCGNCNYLLGSSCGLKTDTEKLNDATKDVVCRDLRCVDEDGERRENGESWCAYQGSIGVDEEIKKTKKDGSIEYDFQRATDTPGSRHFRQVCIDGEIRTEPCADYRNEICVQADTKIEGSSREFSSAACRINRWQQCIEYNIDLQSKTNPDGKTIEERNELCGKNPDCFLKSVDVDEGFAFDLCAPKYPEGFNLKTVETGSAAQKLCGLASQTCTVIYVADMGGDFECVANCECESKAFAEQLNDLCMSLGDCGTKVNYVGDLTINHKVFKGKQPKASAKNEKIKLSDKYIEAIKKYSEIKDGQFASPGNLTEFFGSLGVPDDLGSAQSPTDPSAALGSLGMISGMGGLMLSYGLAKGGTAAINSFALSTFGTSGEMIGPFLGAASGALAGAAIGFAVVSILIQFTGVGPALGEEGTYALIAAGAAEGAVMGASIAIGGGGTGATVAGSFLSILGVLAVVAWVVIIAIVIFIIIEAILGAGEVKKIKYNFQCQPWQAPLGGEKCGQCGQDGFPCSKYSCESLGQTCEYINEGTGEEQCVNVAPDDVSAPVLKPLEEAISPGAQYSDVSSEGFKIKMNENEGCVKSYQNLLFGLSLDESGQCRFDVEHRDTFEDMEYDFGGTSLFLRNHTHIFQTPSLDSLGLPGYDPTRKADYNLYVRCQDRSGNINQREFTINFCLKPGEDLTPPIVTGRSPVSEYVRFNAEELNATVFVNEPSECKWSKNDLDYNIMENSFSCDTDIADQQLLGWTCNTKFNVPNNDTVYYVRCKDQPWLIDETENQSAQIIVTNGTDRNGRPIYTVINSTFNKKRNIMGESYLFNIKRSQSELKIDYVDPENETVVAGVQPVSVKVEVKTSGGVNGKAKCTYRFGETDIAFRDTFGNVHKQVFEQFVPGNYSLPIRCEDQAGNVAERVTKFRIELDTTPPMISRVYNNNGNLILITNENAECAYSFNSCSFNFNNATMMAGDEKNHVSDLENSAFYVKCKDRFGNMPGGCSIVVRGGVL